MDQTNPNYFKSTNAIHQMVKTMDQLKSNTICDEDDNVKTILDEDDGCTLDEDDAVTILWR